jgi:DNA-binding CsgD family transcriptional regulator
MSVATRERPVGREVVYGREAEQKIIRDLLRCAHCGAGGVVLVEGQPGIGTSLLLSDATDEAAHLGFSLVAAAADQLGQAIPFAPLRAALREPFAGLAHDRPDAAAWWITEIRARLEQRAAAAPVLVCLDDLHWASPATLAVLRALPRDMRRRPVAWLLARSTMHHQATDYLFGQLERDGASRVTLAPLDKDAVTAMLTGAFGAPPDEGLADLADGAAGNSALLAELIEGLRDEHAVRVAAGCATLASARLPQRILRLGQRRLDGLSKKARHLLGTAAVLGPAFRLEDAAEMLGETPATLLPAVEEAMDAAIMTAAEHAFTFRHELLRLAIREMIPLPARSALHRQYGEMLLSRGESAVQAAGHLLQAAHPGDPASLPGLDRAAAQTLGSAPRTAADLAVRVLELTPPDDPAALSRAVTAAEALTAAGRLDQADRITADALARPLPPVAEARLRCVLSTVLSARGQARDAADQAQLALAEPDLPRDLRDKALTARLQALAGLRDKLAGPAADAVLAAPGYDGHVTVAALVTRAAIAWDGGQVSDALDLLRAAARHSNGVPLDARHAQPLLALAAALVDLRQLNEADGILDAAGQGALNGLPAEAGLAILRARVQLAAGRPAAADGQVALDIARSIGAHGYAAAAHSVLSAIELRRGDIAAAFRHIACRVAASPQFADLYARQESRLAMAMVTEARDGPTAALGCLRELCADLTARPGLLLGDPALAAWLVRTALAAGDSELAACITRTAHILANAHPGFPALAAAAAHCQGLARRDPALLAEAAAQHADPWARASAREDLGVLHRGRGDRAQVICHLQEALAGYVEAGADRDQARIRNRLRQLGIRRRHWATAAARPVTGWDSLTGTEQAVARFVAEGLTNGQVAARMYISTHTVAHHLRNAFRKLGIASRYELTRIVVERAADAAGSVRLATGATRWLSGQELADGGRDLPGVGLQGEVAGVEKADVRARDVTLEGFGASRQEERVVLAPHREERRPAGAEVLLPRRVERHIAGVVEEQVELDLIVAGAAQVVVVEAVAVRADPRRVRDAVRVLPDRGLRLEHRADRFPVGLRRVLPVGLDGIPAGPQALLVRVAILGNDRGDALGVPGRDAESHWRTVVEHVEREAVEAEHLRPAIDDLREMVERVVEVTPRRHVRLAEPGQVWGDDMEPVGEQRDQLAELVTRGRVAVQEQQRRRVSRSSLPVEHRQAIHVRRAVGDVSHVSSPSSGRTRPRALLPAGCRRRPGPW